MSITRTLFEGTTQPATGTSVSTDPISVEPGDMLVAWASFQEIGVILSSTLSDSGTSTPAWANVESANADVAVGTAGTLAVTAAESITVTMTTSGTVNTPRLLVARLRGDSGNVDYVSRILVALPSSGSTGVISAGTITTSAEEYAFAGLRNGDFWITSTPTGSMVGISESTDWVQAFERNGSGSGTEAFDNGLGGGRAVLCVYVLKEVVTGYVHTRPANPSRMGVDRIARGIH